MGVIFKGILEYCLNDHLNHWLTCYIICECDTLFTLTAHSNEREYLKQDVEPLFHLEFGVRGFVIGCRSVELFILGSLEGDVVQGFPEDMFFIVTEKDLVNLKGKDAHFFLHQLQYKRCERQSALHDYVLDPVFHVLTELGHVCIDESEFLLVITPFEVVLVSLFQRCLVKSWPIVSIRRYGANCTKNQITLEIGRKAKGGNRSYTLNSTAAPQIVSAIKSQIRLISCLISAPSEDTTMNKRFSEGANFEKDFKCKDKLSSLPAAAAGFKFSSALPDFKFSTGIISPNEQRVELGGNAVHWVASDEALCNDNLTYELMYNDEIIYEVAESGGSTGDNMYDQLNTAALEDPDYESVEGGCYDRLDRLMKASVPALPPRANIRGVPGNERHQSSGSKSYVSGSEGNLSSYNLEFSREMYPVNEIIDYESLEICSKQVTYDDVEINSDISKKSKKRGSSKKDKSTFVSYLSSNTSFDHDDNSLESEAAVYDKLVDSQELIYNKLNDPALAKDEYYNKLRR